jgi:endo-1,4-beta-xylanase
MIVVLANGMRNSFYNDSPNGVWPIESVIVKELIPHVDATYRTIAKREDRAVEGFSMGGYGAAHLGFKYPQVFGIVGIMSGALLRPQGVAAMKNGEPPIFEKMFGSDMARVVANDPFELVRQNATAIRGKTAIRIAVGSDDSLLPRNQAMHETLEELKIEHEFEVVPGVGHTAPKFYETLGERAFRYYRKVLESQEKRAQ